MAETETCLNLEEKKNAHGEPTNPKQSQFDELTSVYEEMALWPFRREIEIPNTLAVIGNVSGLSILDFGCGTGIYSRYLKNAGAGRVVGFDPCHRMLQYAKEKAIQFGTEIEFTSQLIPLYNGQFDVVLAVYVLPYATTKAELANMCSQMGNLLKPKGRLITLPIHPDYNLNPDFYEEYGFRLIQQKRCGESFSYIDGGPVELHICHEKLNIRVMATYWSRASVTQALVGAGFSSVSHIDLCKISLESVSSSLVKYVNQPHASLIECKKDDSEK